MRRQYVARGGGEAISRFLCIRSPTFQLVPDYCQRHTLIMNQSPTPVSIPRTHAATPSGSSSTIEGIFDAAIKSYKKKTKKDLKNHDLFKRLETCDSPAAILAVFQASQFDRTRGDDRLKKWLVPAINVLCAFSETLGEGVSLVNIDSSPSVSGHTLMSIFDRYSHQPK
jgi:hypothetical protein